MEKILLLEDDTALGRGIQMALQGDAVQIKLCRTLAQGREETARDDYCLLILDVNLPDGSGLELLRQVRQDSSVPVILLTANDLEMDIVTGLESGADDYITKPFSLAVLRARVNAQLRRSAGGRTARQSLELSKTEQKLLRLLVENRGQTLSRATLVDRVWTDGAEYVDENALSVTVKRLRGKLEDNPSAPKYVKTVYGIGYTWAVK